LAGTIRLQGQEGSMDWLEFWSSVIGSLAWPAAVVAVAAMFKSRLENLLDKIKLAKGAGIELEFTEQVEEVAEQAAAVPTPEQPAAHLPIEPGSQAEREADYFAQLLLRTSLNDRPAAMVLDSWKNVENLLLDVVKARNLQASTARGRLSASQAVRSLAHAGLLDEEQESLIRSLQSLRNRVAHVKFEPDRDAARSYYEASQKAVRILIPLIAK
jgi:hypothetical protein